MHYRDPTGRALKLRWSVEFFLLGWTRNTQGVRVFDITSNIKLKT